MSEKLRGKVAIVTGAGISFGRNFALALAREGAHVVLAARRCEPLEETVQGVAAAHPPCGRDGCAPGGIGAGVSGRRRLRRVAADGGFMGREMA